MTANLCLLCCENFRPDMEAAVAAEGWTDVSVTPFPSRCGRPPLSWDELRPLLGENCSQVEIIGNACLLGLDPMPADAPPVHQLRQDECFHMLGGRTLIDEAVERDAYLVSPGWLANWRGKLREMGFDETTASGFFRDFARELVLLDTGTLPDAPAKLAEFAAAAGLPSRRIGIGLDYLRQWLGRRVADWRLDEARKEARRREQDHARELADHEAAMDFLGRLPLLKDEQETIAAIEEMFHLLFAPQLFRYVVFEGGRMRDEALAADLARQVHSLRNEWSWTESKSGFLLRIARAGETLGVIVVDGFAFPGYRNRYVNLALSISGVAGLAIDNARTYRRLMALQRELEQEAHTDALTGCISRRHFLNLARHELARARRHDESLALLMLDLDHFKEVNDRYGHPVGDRVLKKLVEVCQGLLRREDTLGRLGGEEFAILLPETGRDRAEDVARRLCAAVAATEVPMDTAPALHITTSIGVAPLSHDDVDIAALLDRADRALYEAKRAGRNLVVVA